MRPMLAEFLHLFSPFAWQINGEFGIRWYGLAYVAGFVCAYFLYKWLARHGYAELKESQAGDFITGAAIFGVLLGGRLGYYVFYATSTLWHDPLQVFRIWEGGMSSHGGMIGLILFTLYYSNRHHLSWTNLGDNLCVVAPIGLFFGRLANFVNGELYGRAADGLPWAMKFPTEKLSPEEIAAMRADPATAAEYAQILTPRHPSQIYEALLEGLALFGLLWIIRTRFRTPNGVITGAFFIIYGIFRIFVEQFREPDAGDPLMLGLTRGQILSMFLILIGGAFVIYAMRRAKKPEGPAAS